MYINCNSARIFICDFIIQVISGPHYFEEGCMGDICDGKIFKDNPVFQASSSALQLIVYYDDVQLANPLGSRTKVNKIGESCIITVL